MNWLLRFGLPPALVLIAVQSSCAQGPQVVPSPPEVKFAHPTDFPTVAEHAAALPPCFPEFRTQPPEDRYFIEFLAGAYFTTSLGPDTPTINYAPLAFRYGCRPLQDGNGDWGDR